jgi:vacuolar iron transporter family protein
MRRLYFLYLIIAQCVAEKNVVPSVSVGSLVFLSLLGALSAYGGGANLAVGAMRVTFRGALAMAITAAAGTWFGATIYASLRELCVTRPRIPEDSKD